MSTKTIQNTQKILKISSKSQITLPKSFLSELNIESGQSIIVSLVGQKIEITMNDEKQKIRAMAGKIVPKIKTKLTIEEQIEKAKKEHYDSK
jgi:bifunctional DNA-binding transcriptional regulator/antitoxin component of YhaV-PrlF toxin-antitoxin module